MSGAAIALLVTAILILWGGLAVSIVALARKPDRTDWPQGWVEEADRIDDREAEREARAPVERDT